MKRKRFTVTMSSKFDGLIDAITPKGMLFCIDKWYNTATVGKKEMLFTVKPYQDKFITCGACTRFGKCKLGAGCFKGKRGG